MLTVFQQITSMKKHCNVLAQDHGSSVANGFHIIIQGHNISGIVSQISDILDVLVEVDKKLQLCITGHCPRKAVKFTNSLTYSVLLAFY